MRVLGIVQARMGSSRLPGKVLMPLSGIPAIVHTLRRLKRCKRMDGLVLAVPDDCANEILLKLANEEGVEGFAGDENDVLGRYLGVATKYCPDHVVRCTGDCPLLDAEVTDAIIDCHLEGGWDYTSNTLKRSFPRGLDTEVMKMSVLIRAAQEAMEPAEREHVTPYLYRHTKQFSVEQVVAPKHRWDPGLRLCVDTQKDYELMEKIFKCLYPQDPFFGVDAILDLLRRNPDLRKINQHVEQKLL